MPSKEEQAFIDAYATKLKELNFLAKEAWQLYKLRMTVEKQISEREMTVPHYLPSFHIFPSPTKEG